MESQASIGTSAICNGFEHMGIREIDHHQSLERIEAHPGPEHDREHHVPGHHEHQNDSSQGQSQSEFNLLYERLFDKIQNQEINSQDWSNLENEYRIWVDQMDQNTKSLQDKLKALQNEKETLSKAKAVLEKVKLGSTVELPRTGRNLSALYLPGPKR